MSNFWSFIWDMFKLPFFVMLVINISIGLFKLYSLLEKKKEIKHREAYEKELHEKARRAEELNTQLEAERQARYPWNRNKIKAFMKCPSCGNLIAWPYIGRCSSCSLLITNLDHE